MSHIHNIQTQFENDANAHMDTETEHLHVYF